LIINYSIIYASGEFYDNYYDWLTISTDKFTISSLTYYDQGTYEFQVDWTWDGCDFNQKFIYNFEVIIECPVDGGCVVEEMVNSANYTIYDYYETRVYLTETNFPDSNINAT
jgi:hypothetical protein